METCDIRIGTAGWSMPSAEGGPRRTVLERYGEEFDAVEINTSFYRHHRPSTYSRWRDSVPEGFRLAVKLPRAITHGARLRLEAAPGELERFCAEAGELGDAAGPLLVQLPPSLALDRSVAGPCLREVRAQWPGPVVCEPRHATWFAPEADAMLARLAIARVAADPARVPEAAVPGGDRDIAYLRLHGSPRMYHSAYGPQRLAAWIGVVRAAVDAGAREVWCILDNTASGAALDDARTFRQLLGRA